jgi:hypothetical protein
MSMGWGAMGCWGAEGWQGRPMGGRWAGWPVMHGWGWGGLSGGRPAGRVCMGGRVERACREGVGGQMGAG